MNEFSRKFPLDALDEATRLHIEPQDVTLYVDENSRQIRDPTERLLTIIGEAIRRALDKEVSLSSTESGLREWINLRKNVSHHFDGLSHEKTWLSAGMESGEPIWRRERLPDR